MVIEPGGEATLEAGTDIVLRPGFHAKAGSSVHTFITPIAPPAKSSAGPLAVQNNNTSPKINTVTAYPKPFQNNITFDFYVINENSKITISIYDLGGNPVTMHEKTIPFSGLYSTTLKAQKLKQGIYFYRIFNGSAYYTGKIIKTN